MSQSCPCPKDKKAKEAKKTCAVPAPGVKISGKCTCKADAKNPPKKKKTCGCCFMPMSFNWSSFLGLKKQRPTNEDEDEDSD